MKAIFCNRYGLPTRFDLTEVEMPSPGENDVLVEVHASSVNTNNLLMIKGTPKFVRLMVGSPFKPKYPIPGGDFAGRIVKVGKNVTQFKTGDEVFGNNADNGFGSYAEYVGVSPQTLAKKPVSVSFEEAAGVPEAALVALQGLRDHGNITKGQNVLIYGASGGIGSFAVQIAKYYGAEVTGVCSSKNIKLVRSIGADHVIDYTREDYTENGLQYDCIFAIAFRNISDHLRTLKPDGVYVSTGGPSLKRVFQDMILGSGQKKKVAGGWSATINQKDLAFISELIDSGNIRPIIDRCYPLSEAAEALRYYGIGHPRGKVIITVKKTGEQTS